MAQTCLVSPDLKAKTKQRRREDIPIRTFLASGEQARVNYSLGSCLRLEAIGKVWLVRRNHTVISAHYYAEDGARSVPQSAHMGQHYSVDEKLEDTIYHAWKHKKLPDANTGCDLFVRAVFRNVALSCQVEFKGRVIPKHIADAAAAQPPAKTLTVQKL